MQVSWPAAIADILESEGDELNLSPGEPGGASRMGISLTVLREHHIAHGLPPATLDDLRALTPETAADIYWERFAVPARFDELPAGVDYRYLDTEVNLGVGGGIDLLQLVLGIYPLTRKIDDATLAAVNRMDPKTLIVAIGAAWLSKKHESPGWNPHPGSANGYGHGWTNRRNAADAAALAMVTT